ncbi:hypothetical protein GQ600_12938 [Phytophthora cactorum]|nr:hypothetical protein GQ600_12938 [Phytophthora cactorum]
MPTGAFFLPDSASLAKDTTVKYWHGFKVELKRTWSRVWFVVRASWTDVSLMAYAVLWRAVPVRDYRRCVFRLAWCGGPDLVMTTRMEKAKSRGDWGNLSRSRCMVWMLRTSPRSGAPPVALV